MTLSKQIFSLLCLTLSGCSVLHDSSSKPVTVLLDEASFVAQDFKLVYALHHTKVPDENMTFVIESDGRRWPTVHRPPIDPSPARSIAIGIALEESKWGSVTYIGRPCQYGQRHLLLECEPTLWSDARYGETVISEINRVIDDFVLRNKIKNIHLVGHSGGGVVATLIAARRNDVDCVVSIAAPLDTDKWSRVMGVSKLSHSYNPKDFYRQLLSIPQDHLAGSDDRIVPPDSIVPEDGKAGFRVKILKGFNHFSPWLEKWDQIRASTCLPHKTFKVNPIINRSG